MGAENSILGTQDYPMSNCRIVVVGQRNGDESLTELANLPQQAKILAIGSNLDELRKDWPLFTEANVILNVTGNAQILAPIINEMPFLTWIHSITAGVDHILCPEIVENDDITLTNAKGIFSESLAEYVITACLHYAKDVPRLLQQKSEKKWDKFVVSEIRGKTMGIIGYGDIGRECAKLAKAFGMKVIGLRRTPELSKHDPYIDQAVDNTKLNQVIAESDYLLVCLALTPQTKHFIKAENLQHAKKGQVLINIGRGALLDEDALIEALQNNTLRAAALDVFTTEPLPETSPLWQVENVLISPHNADYTVDNRHKSVRLFTQNCIKFLAGEDLDCIIDKEDGY